MHMTLIADHVAPSNTSMPMTPVATEPDPEFYFDDNLVVIQVGNLNAEA